MMRSLFSGVSGLKNHQTRMDVIGNNIANVNTTGFKGSRVTFQDILSQNIAGAASAQGNKGGTNPKQIGLGMGMASVDTNFGDGSLQSTGKNTDLALSGNGFFILGDGANKIYTRSGAFEFDSDGNYTVPGSGMLVQGWMANEDGTINANGDVTGITIPKGQTMAAKATTYAQFSKNLSAEGKMSTTTEKIEKNGTTDVVTTPSTTTTTVVLSNGDIIKTEITIEATPGADPQETKIINGVTIDDMNLYTALPKDGTITYDPAVGKATKATHVITDAGGKTTTTVYTLDTANQKIDITIDATYANNRKTTKVTTITAPTKVVAPITAYDSEGVAHQITGTFTKNNLNEWVFNPGIKDEAGKIYTDTGYEVTGGEYKIKFKEDGTIDTIAGTPLSFKPDQANTVTIAPDFSKLTQYAGESTATVTDRDGYGKGDLSSVSIDSSGIITGTFSNGLTKSLAQVAIATFNNPAGLTKLGTNTYSESNNSGLVQISTSGNGGAGTITPSNLEMSNVDLSEEFSSMIITQRGFQANSKIITVSDEMLETLTNLKR